MKQEIGIDLENIVYYRGDTHYFVMTALKNCLLKRGVIKEDIDDRAALLAPSNIDKDKLHQFSIDASQFATGHFSKPLPVTEFAPNGRGNPDVAIFDFTNLYHARNASRVKVRKGHQLLMAIVGDSLMEPFWPEGTGCARGFLSSMDAAWMFRRWISSVSTNPLDILAERENIYRFTVAWRLLIVVTLLISWFFRLLSQTTDGSGGNLKDNHKQFTTDPRTRYRSIPKKIDHDRILSLYDTDLPDEFDFLKDGFVTKKYYSKEQHKKLLPRAKRRLVKQIRKRIIVPIRAATALRRQTSAPV